VAVMGCVVNGPGESKHADVGISVPGTGEGSKAVVYVDGARHGALEGPDLADDFLAIIDAYVERRFGDEIGHEPVDDGADGGENFTESADDTVPRGDTRRC
ncbi:MAG: flavodoxin-dependent (E)-4-hydroxy-3-methylbut-2-enyl-diphosphate synthase, partial [Deltaproteobacteria bacterium]|nr:flavodoxin-dependent (E)-4-hydroxy-3-methylbut-2-enyl-diphosphate synthase [Deltaproteobacteria bacterium]